VIISFADQVTEKIFMGESLTRKEINQLGDLNLNKAQERLAILNRTNEKDLLTLSFLNYHRLQGTERYSIDANSRRSKWRITFSWNKESRVDVQLVKIEDTHK
jgi:plasmid maintenance system killer protein